jgi:hypothetical protein
MARAGMDVAFLNRLVSSPLIWNLATYVQLVSMYRICRALQSQLAAMSCLQGKFSRAFFNRKKVKNGSYRKFSCLAAGKSLEWLVEFFAFDLRRVQCVCFTQIGLCCVVSLGCACLARRPQLGANRVLQEK